MVSCPVASRSTRLSPPFPAGSSRRRQWSARSCRCAPRCGVKATMRLPRRWWCVSTAPPTPNWSSGPSQPEAEPVPIEALVSGSSRIKPQRLPMFAGRTPDVFHGQFVPDAVGLWTFRVDGWGDPIATWRKAVLAKLDAGQSETELSNDLLIGAKLLERAATGVPRQRRTPMLDAAARLRAPGEPAVRAGAALTPEITELLTEYPLRELVHAGRPVRRLGGPTGGALRRLVRVVSQVHRGPRRRGCSRARHLRHGRQVASAGREDGFRRRLPAADPPDRRGTPQGPQQHRDRRAG